MLWLYATPQFRDKFKRDAAAGTRFWRAGTNLLAKLPKKPQRTVEQQLAADIILLRCRDARERFLRAHAGAVYRKLTNGLEKFLRVDELVYEAAKLVPGLTPTQQAGQGRKRIDAEREGRRRDRPGHFPGAGAGAARKRHASLRSHAAAEDRKRSSACRNSSARASSISARRASSGKARPAIVTVNNPRFLNAEDDDTLDDTETAADIAILDPLSEICVLRGGVVDHPKYAGRKIFSAGINLTHLYRGKIPYLWYIRRDMGVVNKMLRGLAMGAASPDEVYGGTREKPWVAQLDVFAIGGGCQYLLAMDYVVAG